MNGDGKLTVLPHDPELAWRIFSVARRLAGKEPTRETYRYWLREIVDLVAAANHVVLLDESRLRNWRMKR
jgi:hypothetical protein